MELYEQSRISSQKYLKQADHLLRITYPLIKDSKILLSVVDNVFLAQAALLNAALQFERLYKKIPSFPDTFDGKLNAFRLYCLRRHGVSIKYLNLFREVKKIVLLHKSSPVEFRKKDRFIICTDSYQVVAITLNQLKGFINETRGFSSVVDSIIAKK